MIDPVPPFVPFEKEDTEKLKEESLRNLATQSTLSKPGFIPLSQDTNIQKSNWYSYYHVLKNIKKFQSSILYYPYSFTYTEEEGNSTTFEEGGFFNLKAENWTESEGFSFIKTKTDVKIGKAKAIYDASMAILKFEATIDDNPMDLFYESDSFCSLIQSSYSKYSTCLKGKEAFEQAQKEKPQGTNIVYIGPEDISNGILESDDGSVRIGILVIPDCVLDSYDQINNMLGSSGITKITNFIKNGGNVIVSGKSGYLLEKWGIINAGTYDTQYTLTSSGDMNPLLTDYNKTEFPSTASFEKLVLATNIQKRMYLTSAHPMKGDNSNNFEIVANFDTTSKNLQLQDKDGNKQALPDSYKTYLPALLYKEYGKGKMIIFNANALFKGSYANVVLNAYLVCLSKSAIFDFYVKVGEDPSLPIPGGEGGIVLSTGIDFMNTFDVSISNIELDIFLPYNVTEVSIPSACTKDTSMLDDLNFTGTVINPDYHIKCTKDTLDAFSKYAVSLKIEILDQSVTQKITDITIIYPVIYYTENGIKELIDTGGLKVTAGLGAVLRGSLNPDPSSCYPFPGKGYPADNVIQVENKENTVAKDVVYYGVLPLVSPLVDGVNQEYISYYLQFDNDYYLRHGANKTKPVGNFSVPWTLAEEGSEESKLPQAEFIDFLELSGKGIVLDADWDQSVKIVKKLRASYPLVDQTLEDKKLDVFNAAYSTNINGTEIILEQIYFENSDRFYEVGTQRLMVFVDTRKEEGFSYFYGNNIPDAVEDKAHKGIQKMTVMFSRNDIYFYDNNDYQHPENITYKHIISIDKFQKPPESNCSKAFGAPSYVMNQGYFDHTKPGGLKPNEWSNRLFSLCDHIQIDPYSENFVNPSEDLKFIHYLVPVKEEDIKRAGSLMDFTENSDGKTGYLTEYPMVKFIYGHGAKFEIAPELSRQGGKLTYTLPEGINFTKEVIENDLITYSADQIAFYKTTFDSSTKTVTSFFKRGLMPNEQVGQPSQIEINLECLNSEESFEMQITLDEVKYDVTSKDTDYEYYERRGAFTKKYLFEYKPYYSLPAVEIANHFHRNDSTEIKEYELLAPYTRYGVYQQEILRHRTVYSFAEVHNVKDPGLVAPNGGFATISNIGISSIPNREFVTHGGLLIPAAARTSRLEWVDIWGRKWEQPLRSVFPDIPPIPPPLKNFVMSTTFELVSASTGERLLEWPSDEKAMVHVQLKFLNNYPKFFLSIICPQNGYPFVKQKAYEFKNDRIFTREAPETTIYPENTTDYKRTDLDISFGFSSVYGNCFKTTDAMLSGSKLNEEDLKKMEYAMTCSASDDAAKIKQCELELSGVKTLSRRPENNTDDTNYNYSPYVENFYPKGYIKRNMWDLTHYDYDDNAMDKAYRYHCGNNLPSLDVCPPQNPAYYKPHNTVTFPIFKGFGYEMTYANNKGLPGEGGKRYSGYKGWWSDNLQNQDNTLLAGQETSNDVSVGKETLLPTKKWINVRQLDKERSKFLTERLKNIYVCEFNQHRVRVSANQSIFSFPENVLQNNVVPIHPDLKDEDERLTQFNCPDDFYQYSPKNISQVDNVVKTNNDRDWLYFALNLRGGARENIHILMNLNPFSDRKYEGITKVQDGGRFIYWNPVNGPNSFLNVENPVNTVEAYRIDLIVEESIYPNEIPTFNGEIYKVYTVKDENEILREYEEKTYTNSYGFGDSTITVYVGGTENSECKIGVGDTTYVKITFYNNCGFDWNLKGDSIDFEGRGSMPISANDLLMNFKHTIQAPLSYNFLKLEIPDDLKDYIEIKPSDHNIKTAPQFFDFENINVATIRDGFEGNYFYRLKILKELPKKYWGKLTSMNVSINKEDFDQLPGPNDPTGIHDYELIIPPIKFAFPYPEGEHKGKVYVVYGRSDNLIVMQNNHKDLMVESAKFISEEDHQKIIQYTLDASTVLTNIRALYDNLKEDIKFNSNLTADANQINFTFSNTKYNIFPKENEGIPDTAQFKFIAKHTSKVMEFGYKYMDTSTYIVYNNIKRNKTKSVRMTSPWSGGLNARGAFLSVSYSSALVALNDEGTFFKLDEQKAYPTDAGTIRVGITAKNIGSKECYRTTFKISYNPNLKFIADQLNEEFNYTIEEKEEENILTVNTFSAIIVGEKYSETFYFDFPPLKKDPTKLRQLEEDKWVIINKVTGIMDLTDEPGINTVEQPLNKQFALTYASGERSYQLSTSIQYLEKEGSFTQPKFSIVATPTIKSAPSGEKYCYKFYKKVIYGNSFDEKYILASDGCIESNTFTDDSPLKGSLIEPETLNNYTMEYKSEMYVQGQTSYKVASSAEYNLKYVEPKPEEKGGLSVIVIILIILGAIIVLGAIAVGVLHLLGARVKNKDIEKNDERVARRVRNFIEEPEE
ncbi:MAG: hypothetical protein MJ252_02885 [archaeon]|nr:hypothetical protein [archaeon]